MNILFANSYQLITTINANEELIKSKEKETINLQEKIKHLNILRRGERKELETQLSQTQTEITQLTTENQTLIDKVKEERLQKLQDWLKHLEEEKVQLIKRTSDLEILTKESEKLIKNQKEKVTNVYHYTFEEEEKKDLDELIRTHKNYMEAKKQRLSSWELKQKYDKLYYQLMEKLGKDFIEAVEMVITNFEELYESEWRLQEQLKEKEQITITKQLLEENIQKSIQIVNLQTQLNLKESQVRELKGQFTLNLLAENKEKNEQIKAQLRNNSSQEQFEQLIQTRDKLLHEETLLKNKLEELTIQEQVQVHTLQLPKTN